MQSEIITTSHVTSLRNHGPISRLKDDGSAVVSVHALSCGEFTLPEYQFVRPVSKDARRTVPSLAFIIEHRNPRSSKLTRVVFDLGLRKDVNRYAPSIQKHIETRQPMTRDHDVIKSLARAGLCAHDIDYVIYSHVHWDHIGEPRDFPTSTFVVGHGSSTLLSGSDSTLCGSHSCFEPDLLPAGRTIELTDPMLCRSESGSVMEPGAISFTTLWRALGDLLSTLDVFNDGSLLIVDAPGHLPGHINLLAQVSPTHRIYLAGDACHDRRLLTGEKLIGEWHDAQGHICCIHANREEAEETIDRIRALERQGVEIIFAHDSDWTSKPENRMRFFGTANGSDV